MKKKHIIGIVSALLILISILFPYLWNTSLKGHVRGSSLYLEKAYYDFYGGKEASSFFEKYITTDNYLAIDFYYSDDGRIIFPLMKSYTAFIVDIYLKEDEFNQTVLDLSSEEYEPKSINNSFIFVKINDQDKLYKDNFAAIGWDANHNTLRYVFVCDKKNGNVYNIQTTYLRFYDLNWNDNENDYIFDYSENTALQ